MSAFTQIQSNAEAEEISIVRVDENGDLIDPYPIIQINLADLVGLVGNTSDQVVKLRWLKYKDAVTCLPMKVPVLMGEPVPDN